MTRSTKELITGLLGCVLLGLGAGVLFAIVDICFRGWPWTQ